VANVPVSRTELTSALTRAALEPRVPQPVLELLQTLWSAGHAAYVVGGSLRDILLGRQPYDWDLTTDARPERIQALFPRSIYENRFGTVAVRREGVIYQITTFRSDHGYADHRRPHHVEFGDSIEADLARRDFTVNAMAWGAAATGSSGTSPQLELVDPFGGALDAAGRLLRAVGEPDGRFEEDALRMIRAVRLAAALDFTVEPATMAAIASHAELARHLSGERVAVELMRLLEATQPSVGLRLMEESGLLAVVAPILAAQRGVSQNKIPGDDLWAHCLRTVDAATPDRPTVRMAALLHDVGKPGTAADGHFYGHETAGADLAAEFLGRLHLPQSLTAAVANLVRNHMFNYDSSWSDAAVRRFINKVGRDAVDDLFELRAADNVGSGQPRDAGELGDLRRRVAEQLQAHVALTLRDLAIHGDDLIAELGLAPGPTVGRTLDALLDQVIADSSLNDRATLLALARAMLEDGR
jgi:tRNA nucleotidyltransferase (CCA-adding enzyme)